MSSFRKSFQNFILLGLLFLLLLCALAYSTDLYWGDGDGLIAQWHFNPLTVGVLGTLIMLPLAGIVSGRKALSNISLTVFTILLSLLSVEFVLLPLSNWETPSHHRLENLGEGPIFSRYDTLYFKNYLPHAHFITHLQEPEQQYSIENQINSLGIRGPEIGSKPLGERRILLLGDSFLQSDEISYSHTIGQQLEQLFADSVRVIQHGNPSWSPLLELNWLLRTGLDLEPDQVILFLYYNDFFPGKWVGDTGYTPFCRFDEKGLPQSFQFGNAALSSKKENGPWQQMKESWPRLRMVRLLRQALGKKRNQVFFSQASESYLNCSKDSIAYQLQNWETLYEAKSWGLLSTMRDTNLWDTMTIQRLELSAHYLRLMQKVLKEKNIDFQITLIPQPWQFAGEQEPIKSFYGFEQFIFPRGGLESYLHGFCGKQGIPFLPLYPYFYKYKQSSTELLYFPLDGHWTATGHRLAAQTIFDLLHLQSKALE